MPRRNGSTTTTNTAPWKTVFSKTQTRGQAELTGVLTRLAIGVRRTEGAIVAPTGRGAADRDRARRNGARSSEPQAAAGSGWRR